MTFDSRDLRRGKDVFGADGTYLGTLIWTIGEPRRSGGRAGPHDHTERPVVRQVPSGATEGTAPAFSGESIGPMPTSALGNRGPSQQSPATAYATASAEALSEPARRPAELVILRLLTMLNWSTLRPRVWRIPTSLVQAVSHERIMLSVTATVLEAGRASSP